MAWDVRGERRYGYRSVRVNGQPRRIYLGTGPAAEDYARQAAERGQRWRAEREALHAEQAKVAPAEGALEELRAVVALLVRATLILAGLHEHHGEWRRRTKP